MRTGSYERCLRIAMVTTTAMIQNATVPIVAKEPACHFLRDRDGNAAVRRCHPCACIPERAPPHPPRAESESGTSAGGSGAGEPDSPM
jgi:hypothetical protein